MLLDKKKKKKKCISRVQLWDTGVQVWCKSSFILKRDNYQIMNLIMMVDHKIRSVSLGGIWWKQKLISVHPVLLKVVSWLNTLMPMVLPFDEAVLKLFHHWCGTWGCIAVNIKLWCWDVLQCTLIDRPQLLQRTCHYHHQDIR